MKNSSTMLAEARSIAISKGARDFRKFAGYAITQKELKVLYLRNGFNLKRDTLQRHIDIWTELDEVRGYKAGDDGEMVYFMALDYEKDSKLREKAQEKYPEKNWIDSFTGVLAS